MPSHRSQELKEMLPEGVLSIAIRAHFWQSQKRNKSGIDRILTSMCCPRQYEHIDIKKVANNHATDILDRYQKGQNFVVLFLFLGHTFYFHAVSQELLQIQT